MLLLIRPPSSDTTTPTIGSRRAVDFEVFGLKVLDVYRLGQIADLLEASTDWLLGGSNVMEVNETPEPPKKKGRKAVS